MGEPAIPGANDVVEALEYATRWVQAVRDDEDGPFAGLSQELFNVCNVLVLAARGAAYSFGVYRTTTEVDEKAIIARLSYLVDLGAVDIGCVAALLDKADSPKR